MVHDCLAASEKSLVSLRKKEKAPCWRRAAGDAMGKVGRARDSWAWGRSGFYFKHIKEPLQCVKQKCDMIWLIILHGQLLPFGAWTRKEQEGKPADQLGGCYTLCIPGIKAEKERGGWSSKEQGLLRGAWEWWSERVPEEGCLSLSCTGCERHLHLPREKVSGNLESSGDR